MRRDQGRRAKPLEQPGHDLHPALRALPPHHRDREGREAMSEHCNGEDCARRLDPKKQVPFPGCSCGCAACEAIGVDAGIRPPGITLTGWTCACGAFNGTAKENLVYCRCCGGERT